MNFEKELFIISQLFTEKFNDIYSNIKKQGKKVLLEKYNSIYRKWYFSAFFDENVLSPAHLIYRVNEKENKNQNKNDYYVPNIKIKSKSRFNGFDIKILNYNANNHPIIDDLEIVAKNCNIITINDKGIVIDEVIQKIFKKLSIDESEYLEYLINIGTRLKIFKKMPSIYSEVYNINPKGLSFFKKDRRQCFIEFLEQAIKYSCDMINEFFPDDQAFFSPEYIKNILKEPILIESIFKDIFSTVGVDIEELCRYEDEFESGNIDEFADAILSSAYFLKILVDKWFIIPFGDYLKIIMPIYVYSYDFEEKMYGIIEDSKIIDAFDFSPFVYYPCSKYCLTPVAFDVFEIKNVKDEYSEIFERFPINIIIDTVVMGVETEKLNNVKESLKENVDIYEIKVRDKNYKELWQVVQVEGNYTLTMLHLQLCKMFNLYPFDRYSFFLDVKMTPFSEYVPKNQAKRNSKRTENTKILDLNFEAKQKFIYKHYKDSNKEFVADNEDPFFLFEIEVLKIKEKNPKHTYPRVSRVSNIVKLLNVDLKF